ncbi:MAG TPA: RNA 2',3'-cyclic phosphodiesterase [Rugosimonospora sp.]|nr:RNA 2',3'-cyclic phosphodiesterase [Rugosimonospora sp.]
MRLFVAGYPPSGAVAHLAGYCAGLHAVRAGVRVARADTWHVTLAFLGEVADERLPDVVRAVELAAGTLDAPPRVRVSGGGTFGRGPSTTLWAGLAGAVADVEELGRRVRRALGRARLDYDHKPVRPPLTLARPGDRVPAALVDEDLASLAAYAGPEWTFDAAVVVRSTLGAVARYEPLRTVPVGRAAPASPAPLGQ